MAEITLKDGLIYAAVSISHGKNEVRIKNALIDTGSAATVISSIVTSVL